MTLQAERTDVAPAPVEAPDDGTVAGDSMVVSFWTIVSRVTGLVRLAVIAAVLGPTFMGNTFQAANLVPNAVFEFLTGSLLVNVLVPHLVRYVRRDDRRDVERVAGGFLGVATLLFTLVVAALILARPLLLHGFTAAVRDPATAAAQRRAGSILLLFILPQIVLYVIAGTAGAVMNATGRFALPAAGPALENIGTIATIAVAGIAFGTGVDVRHAPERFLLVLGIGATGAVLMHATMLWAGCLRAGILLRPRLAHRDAEVRTILRDLAPTMGQAGLNALRTMTSLVVGNVIAGGVVAFQLALTFFYLPPAISAKSVGVAMLRRLSLKRDEGDEEGFRREFGRGIALTAFVTIPCAVAFCLLAFPLVRGLSFGQMANPRAIGLAAIALVALAPGVLGESAYLLGTYASYARGDASSPFRSAILRTAISVGGMIAAARFVRSGALMASLGAAITLGNIVGSADLMRRIRGSLPRAADLRATCVPIALTSGAMAAAAWLSYSVLHATLHVPFARSFAVVGAVAIGGATYLAFERRRGSAELAMFAEGLSGHVLRGPNLSSSVSFEPDGTVARKVFDGPDGRARAIYEFDRLALSAQALRTCDDIVPVRAIELVETPVPAVRMTRADGTCLLTYLHETELDPAEVDRIARTLGEAVRTYTTASSEPYYDFHVRNCVIDPRTKHLALVDFGIPDQFRDLTDVSRPLEISLGNLVASVVFEAARPYQVLRFRQRRQSIAVAAAVLRTSRGSRAGVERAARTAFEHCAREGSLARRTWYRTAGHLLARRAARRFDDVRVLPPMSFERKVHIAAIAAGVVAAPLAATSPVRAIAGLCALALVAAVAVYPPVAAYTLFAATPLVVGINRGSALPLLRPHEALVLLIGSVLLVRSVVVWTRTGWPKVLRLPPMDVAIALLVLTGSILPVTWTIARGHALTKDDGLYALVMWKYAATYLIVRASVRSSKDIRRALALSVGATSIVAIVGILQALKLFGVPSILMHLYAPDGVSDLVSNNRATATIGNSIALADVMVIHIGIVIAWMLRTKRHRTLLAGCAVLFCIGALASGQMSGVIGLGVTLVALAYLTGHVKQVAIASAGVLVVAAIALQPVIHQRLDHIDPVSRLPKSWVARGENLKEYFLPPLASPANVVLGVRPAARVPSNEPWRDWVYIESGFIWLLWTGGIPLALAFFIYVRRGLRETRPLARTRAGPTGIAATGAFVAIAVVAALMPFDPHLTMRGSADLTFGLLGLALAGVADPLVGRFVRVTKREATEPPAPKHICVVRHREYEPKIRREAEALREAGHTVDVLCLSEPGHRFIEKDNGVRVIRLPLSRTKGGRLRYIADYLSFFLGTALALGVLDLAHHYDAVQVSTMPDFLAFAPFIPRRRGAKVIVFMQEPCPELADLTIGARFRPLLARVEQAAIRSADQVFTVTEQLKERYVARGADPAKIAVVLNGPDPAMLAGVVREPSDHFTLLCHGSIEDRYGHDDLLEAVRIAREEIPGLRLEITGTGSGAERLVRRIEELGLHDTVRYLGFISFDELRTKIASADVGIVAMRNTAYANLVHTNKMFDFMIAGVPVVATRLDAVASCFPDDAIAYAEPDDPRSMAAAIVDLYRDPERRRNMVERASDLYGTTYGWPAQKRIFVDTFEAAL